MQTQLFGQQLTLSSIFPSQPVPTAAAKQASEERYNAIQREIMEEIADKEERIIELKSQIEVDEEALSRAEEDELDLEPEEGEEVIFDAVAPMLEEDLSYTRYENEAEIRALECEIAELEARLKHAN
jgi:uncharacterized protein YceH (UPF0502 family)